MEMITLPTSTDAMWNERLASIMPANFMNNTASTYTVAAGFLENMINRIGRTIILGQKNVNDPFSDWTDPVMDYGDTIQKYCVPFIKGQKPDYDPVDPNPFITVKTKPEVQYIKFNDDVQYQQTIFNVKLREAFMSASQFGSFTAELVQSIYNSAGLDRFNKWKKYLSKTDYINQSSGKALLNVDYDDTAPTDYGREVWRTIKKLVQNEMKFPSKNFNVANMISAAPRFDVVMTAECKRLIDESLEGVFNLELTSIGNIDLKVVDSFATVSGVENELDVVVLAKGMAHYTPRSPESGAIYNPKNYYTNMFYKEAGAFSFDPFFNAAQIYKAPVSSSP